MKSGIYVIQCMTTGKCYIGQSKDIHNRLLSHKASLKINKHRNPKLQNSYNKYGENNFSYNTLILCDIDVIDIHEVFYIKLFDSIVNGFNLESGGNLNKTISSEARYKMSIAKIGKPTGRKGIKFTDELKLKLSLAHIGNPSPMKGKKTNKPAWNSGKIGVQVSKTKIPVEVIDTITGENLGKFESISDFRKIKNYKSKNTIKITEKESKCGRYKILIL